MDVDGPLNPYGAPWFVQQTPASGYAFHEVTPSDGITYRVALNPEHGRELQRLAGCFELAWASTWREDANRLISPLLGLPTDLPVVPLMQPRFHDVLRSWKAEQIANWVGSRPFVWFDDEINLATRRWLDAQETLGRHLAHHVQPDVGLMASDFHAFRVFGCG
jgi:HAD domain in Swiss Army Knife RNA repair proteins